MLKSSIKKTIPPYEIELIIAHIIQKSREYILAHPEIQLTKVQDTRYKKLLKRRKNHEPMAYILGHKEFYGLDFKVNKHTLIPRPETELLVELVTQNVKLETIKNKKISIVDVGTGSGNIIISILKELEKFNSFYVSHFTFHATDISTEALRIARYNAKIHKVDKKIKFIRSNLLKYFIDHCSLLTDHCIIVANLPYLSKKIYSSAMPDVKNFEPKSALLSEQDGLNHYGKLFEQIKLLTDHCSLITVHCLLEFSPEQKSKLQKIIKEYFPASKATFHKDLSDKWRVAQIKI